MTSSLHRRAAAALAAGLVVALVAGCGGSTATTQDVLARGNAICASATRSVRGLAPPTGGATGGPALAGYFERLLPIITTEVAQLRKLPRPRAHQGLLDRYIATVTADESTYRSLVAAAQRVDSASVNGYLVTLRTSRAQSLARQYGLTQCSTTASTAP